MSKLFVVLIFAFIAMSEDLELEKLKAGHHVIIVACGNAWGPCESASPSNQMRQVTKGLNIEVVPVTWGGVKWEKAYAEGHRVVKKVSERIGPTGKIMYAGQSAGAWLSSIVPTREEKKKYNFVGFISLYGPLDLPTLWQKNQWGKINSPRGPILYVMPWGIPGCDNCNDPFPEGDSWFWNTTNPEDPKNNARMKQANLASPYHYFKKDSPAFFAAQGLQDGIIGQYQGVTQARRMIDKLNRTEDVLVECPTLAHGFPFTHPCVRDKLRDFISKCFEV